MIAPTSYKITYLDSETYHHACVRARCAAIEAVPVLGPWSRHEQPYTGRSGALVRDTYYFAEMADAERLQSRCGGLIGSA